MNTMNLASLKRGALLVILVSAMAFSFESCAVNSDFLNSSVVPAAKGKIKVKRDNKNQNYVIKLNVNGLAEVERLQTSKHNYVVWMETEQGKTENLGKLSSTTGFMSNKLKAELETVSSYKPIRVFITAEYHPDVQYPGTEVILTTGKF